MGDVLMNLPAIGLLRQNFPKAWITLLADRSVAGLFSGHADLDEVMEVDALALSKDARARRDLKRRVRQARYDLAVVSNPGKFFHFLCFACRIPLRVGWRRKWPFLLNRSLPDKKDEGLVHEIDSNLSLVRLVCPKTSWDGRVRLTVDETASREVKQLLDDSGVFGKIVVLHASSSRPEKKWPSANYAELCRRLRSNKDLSTVLIGTEGEKAEADQIIRSSGGAALNLCGKLSLKQLVAFFNEARVRALISSDSGPVHVAWMCGKPVVAFYAADVPGSNPTRWGPRDGRSQVLFKPIRDIRVEEAWEALGRVLKNDP